MDILSAIRKISVTSELLVSTKASPAIKRCQTKFSSLERISSLCVSIRNHWKEMISSNGAVAAKPSIQSSAPASLTEPDTLTSQVASRAAEDSPRDGDDAAVSDELVVQAALDRLPKTRKNVRSV